MGEQRRWKIGEEEIKVRRRLKRNTEYKKEEAVAGRGRERRKAQVGSRAWWRPANDAAVVRCSSSGARQARRRRSVGAARIQI